MPTSKDDEQLEAWLKDRPECIRAAVRKRNPYKLYRMDGFIVFIMSYLEPDEGPQMCEHCKASGWPQHHHQGAAGVATVSVGISSKFNPAVVFERRVWGVGLDSLVEISPEEQAMIDRSLAAEAN
jgi:hypothetical protein